MRLVRRIIVSLIILTALGAGQAYSQTKDNWRLDGRLIDAVGAMSDGQFEKATKLLDEIVIADPGNDAAWYYKGMCALYVRDVKGAQDALKKASEIEQEARVKSDEILANAQKQAQKDYQEALSEARKRVAALYDKHKEDGSSSNTANDAASEKAAEKLRDDAEPNREAAITAAMNILMGRN